MDEITVAELINLCRKIVEKDNSRGIYLHRVDPKLWKRLKEILENYKDGTTTQ